MCLCPVVCDFTFCKNSHVEGQTIQPLLHTKYYLSGSQSNCYIVIVLQQPINLRVVFILTVFIHGCKKMCKKKWKTIYRPVISGAGSGSLKHTANRPMLPGRHILYTRWPKYKFHERRWELLVAYPPGMCTIKSIFLVTLVSPVNIIVGWHL